MRVPLNKWMRHPPAKRKPRLPLGGGFCLVFACGVAWLGLARPGLAQTLKLGQFELYSTAAVLVGYDSNVDGVYPEAVDPDKQKADFYWMPSLTLRTRPVPMRPRTTFDAGAGIGYQDYFVRNDLDTEVYDAAINFRTVHPRLTLGGTLGTVYSVDASEDKYYPGGASFDPNRTDTAGINVNWIYRKLGLESSAIYTGVRHDLEKYQADDNDETVLFAGATLNNVHRLSLDVSVQKTDTLYIQSRQQTEESVLSYGALYDLFRWGGLFYTSERTITVIKPSGAKTDNTENTFGISGAIPLDLWPTPGSRIPSGPSMKRQKLPTEQSLKNSSLCIQSPLPTNSNIQDGSVKWSSDLE